MMGHVHRWKVRAADDLERVGEVIAESFSEDGKWLKTIFADEIDRCLNATSRLSAEDVDILLHPTNYGAGDVETSTDNLRAYARELEGK